MVLERAKRLVEHKHDVVILLTVSPACQAHNLVVPQRRTLSGVWTRQPCTSPAVF